MQRARRLRRLGQSLLASGATVQAMLQAWVGLPAGIIRDLSGGWLSSADVVVAGMSALLFRSALRAVGAACQAWGR
jgi:hypothetical protein